MFAKTGIYSKVSNIKFHLGTNIKLNILKLIKLIIKFIIRNKFLHNKHNIKFWNKIYNYYKL